MGQLVAITKNTFLQTVRQPVYGIIVLVTLAGLGLSPTVTAYTLDDDNKMLRDIGLSTLLIQGLFLACFAASSVLDAEIEEKTVLTVAAKPIRRWVFTLGKYLGVLGALVAAHYLAGIALFMTMRHGVLQAAWEKPDLTVLVFGPGLFAVVAIIAAILNYLYDCRYLVTLFTLSVPALTLGAAVLLVIDRDWKVRTYEITQTMDDLPPEAVEAASLKGIVQFRPLEGEKQITGHRGLLVRRSWQGPIDDADREYLLNLSDSFRWKRDVNFLVEETRKLEGTEVFKAALLILVAIAVLASAAVAAATRVGAISTFLVCLCLTAMGLASDQVVRPLADAGTTWARVLYGVIPNFQCMWMIDALSDHRIIPWGYVASTAGYGLLYVLAGVLLAMALFETREVG